MLNRSRFCSFTGALAAGVLMAGPVSAAPITFQLNNDSAVGGSTGNGSLGTTSLVLTSGGLTLTLGALGDTATDIGAGGTGSQSGLGVFSAKADSSNQLEKSSGAFTLNEGFSFSFTDGSGNVDVDVTKIEFTVFRGTDGDKADLNIGTFSQTFNGGSNNSNIFFTLASPQRLDAGTNGTVLASAGNGFRLRSLTVEVVPEPASLVLLGLGGLAMLPRRSRRA